MDDPHLEPEPPIPGWVARATLALTQAASRVRVIAATTPVNLTAELARLGALARGPGLEAPQFMYEQASLHTGIRSALDGIAVDLATRGELGALYAARARELSDDAGICDAAGGPGFWEAARRRYAHRDRFEVEADKVAEAWLAEPAPYLDGVELVRSDDERSPYSLVNRVRQELGRLRLPLRVIVGKNLASLAATGEGFVHVIADRPLRRVDVERTVLHEIAGHVVPRAAASGARLGLFALGTARGADDQEGRALMIESAGGFLDAGRRRELALRHVAARSVEGRADFIETSRLLQGHGTTIDTALLIAARVHRGGGLAREVVYLPAMLRVQAAVTLDPTIDRVLGHGRIAVEAAAALRSWVPREPST